MLQTASFTGFLRTLLIILLVYYAIKFLSRLFAPLMVRYMSKKMEERFGGQFKQQNQYEKKQKEGETIIDKMPKQESSSNKDVGEYIDYEEID